ncbi:MAG TPA: hypothetical protein VG122_15640 [Gemmata sp.]|nr:hypothetical protein [Gemmata sp.]
MNYTVTWTPDAEQALAAIWLAAPDRNAITTASHRLDQDLANDPFARGVRRNASVNRTATELPLGIDYEIIEDDKKVRVLRVWSLV